MSSSLTPIPSFWDEFWYGLKQNKGALFGGALILGFFLLGLLAPVIAPHNPTEIFSEALNLPPVWSEGGSWQYPLGTDDVGRDVFSRLLYGARLSLSIGALVVLITALLGTFLGLISGYVGGTLDRFIMRLMEMILALPSVLLAIVVVSLLGPGLFNAVLAVALVCLPHFVKVVRSKAMVEKNKQYVTASKSYGARAWRQMFINILPNCLPPLIVQITLGFSTAILDTAALGFLGLGAQAPTPEWGTMLSDARAYIETSPWMVTLPGVCIFLVVLSLNLFGDGLRDALDPRLKR